MTHLEAVDQMIQEGEQAIENMKTQIVKQEVMDRLGKRLMLQGAKYDEKVGQVQKTLTGMKQSLTSLEGAQKQLVSLREDMLAEDGATE